MSRKVRIAYNGPALSNGEMDVRDLAPALLAFADLVNKANTIIGGEHAVKVLLNQDSIQKGSFDVTMLLDMNVLDQARLLVGVANDNGLSELLTVLGWGETVVGATVPVVAGIFQLVQAMAGSEPTCIQHRDDGYVGITLANNTVIVTGESTLNLYLNVDARKDLEQVTKPVDGNKINSFELRNPDKPDVREAIVSITSKDLPSFKSPDIVPVQEETFPEQEMVMKIVTLALKPDYAWRLSDGESTFTAVIEDKEFLKKVNNRSYIFGAGDMLHVKYVMKQSITGKGNISVERTITKVIKVIPKPTQIPLPFGK